MKFWAKVNLKGKEEAENLLNAFWEDFHSDSSIHIKGGIANIEIVFNNEKIPKKISSAIICCEDYEFHYEKSSEEDVSRPKETITVDSDEKLEEKKKVPNTRKNVLSESGAKVLSRKRYAKLQSEEIEQIAKESNSYEDFIISVAKWVSVKHREELFINLAKYCVNLEEISWKALEESKIQFNISDRNLMSKQVSEKFSNSKNPLRILELFEVIKLYKEYNFSNNQKSNVRMSCMPKIPFFEEILSKINKESPIEERIKLVLEAMGLSKKSSIEQEELLKFVKIGLTHKLINDDIFVTADIPMEGIVMNRMNLYEFINSFVKENAINYNESEHKVKAYDFLKNLQLIIVNENEIKV